MLAWLFLAPWIALGIAVFWVAFRGGPAVTAGRAVTGGERSVGIVTPLSYFILGLAIPGLVIFVLGIVWWVRAANREWREVEAGDHGSHASADDQPAH